MVNRLWIFSCTIIKSMFAQHIPYNLITQIWQQVLDQEFQDKNPWGNPKSYGNFRTVPHYTLDW